MSGGIAYVYDVKAQFADRCNREMVDLDPVDADDARVLQDMIMKHYAYTGSTIARFVLDDFENQLKNFVKVFPADYKKVLQAKKHPYRQVSNAMINDYKQLRLTTINYKIQWVSHRVFRVYERVARQIASAG